MTKKALIELQYLPPIRYMTKFVAYEEVSLEQHEHYRKGTYRNRTYIAGANGPLRLTIPLRKGKNQQQPIRSVRIAYDQPWQAHHWESIRSAYGNAPFFHFYADELEPFYRKPFEYLFDWNRELLILIFDLLGLVPRLSYTTSWQEKAPAGFDDLRNTVHPKAHRREPDPHFQPAPYAQVFLEKHDFLPNLSILDLLFCAGPESLSVLEASVIP